MYQVWWVRALVGQTKDYETGICGYSSKKTVLRSKSKDWLSRNQDNMF
jgi:hypothetical protein